jgi:hypothetical protein
MIAGIGRYMKMTTGLESEQGATLRGWQCGADESHGRHWALCER